MACDHARATTDLTSRDARLAVREGRITHGDDAVLDPSKLADLNLVLDT
jgi:hypothetical protein